MGKVEATGDGHQRRNHNQAESHRGRGWHHHRRGRGRRHTFSAGAMRKRFEECHYAKGGSKEDPLNLNGIENEPDEPQRPQPEVYSEPEESNFFPRNRRDPLGLRNIGKDKRKRNRERDRSRSNSPARKQRRSNSPRSSANPNDAQTKEEKEKKLAIEEKTRQEEEKAKQIRKERKEHFNQKYSYGNFDRYYGTRIDSGQKDPRLQVMDREWFEKKTVLDVGCNVGFLTLSIAREFCPRRILGIDIDDHLVGVARKNIRHYCDQNVEVIGKFPASFVNHFGPISQLPTGFSTKFPDNVWFRKENFVLECDELLDTIQEEFDVILALSITKWIHLNWGDDGMRRFFRRAFNQLKPGGRFILEAQPYSSYKKRSGMTEATKEHYQKIEFKPADFEMYLLEVVGFERVEHLGAPSAKSKGFEREIDMYVKRPPSFLQKAMGASGSQQTDSSATSSSSTPSTSSSSATSSTNTPTSTSSSNTPNASSTTTTAEETSPSSRAD